MTHFAGFESHFILIGGTACELWMGDFGLEFRATKDLDVVLLAESLPAEFLERFWAFIHEGQYESLEQSETRPSFYRFNKPKDPRHPAMIELFSRNFLSVPDENHLTPIPVRRWRISSPRISVSTRGAPNRVCCGRQVARPGPGVMANA